VNDNERHCSECEAEAASGALLCTSCGASLPAMASAPPPAPIAYTAPAAVASSPVASAQPGSTERAQAIIPGATIWSGFLGVHPKQYTLILTDRRVIFARSTIAMMTRRVADAWNGAKSERKGFLDLLGAEWDACSGWEGRYFETKPDEALAETAENFAVERASITRVSLKTKRYLDSEGDLIADQLLIIRTHSKKYKVLLGLGRGQAKQALRAAGMIKPWWAFRRRSM
jgi:hypothetical protein